MRKGIGRKKLGGVYLLLAGTALSIIVLALCILLASALLSLYFDPITLMPLCAMISLILCSVICSAAISAYGGEDGIKYGSLTALFFALVLFIIGLIASGSFHPGAAISLLLYVCASLPSSIIAKRLFCGKRPRHRR